ncbi:DUF362 domain-containing protein [Candidatus Woesearchaeota archaeon]|nr:DUF362 domain-containing protein [Candidatus Woesearchaeota archaeon]
MIIRWVCEKCNKKWIYPIEKCVYCKGDITKQKGTKIKVIGITKVAIPSPMHPIIPYNILLLQDELGNRIPRKTMKDYKIGDEFVLQKAKTKDAVAAVKVKYDIYEAIKEALELLNGTGLNEDDKILIKPSIITPAYPYQAVNTNPDFLSALLTLLFELGVKKENVIVAEQALIGSDASDAASKAGIIEVCKKKGVEFADISKGPFEDVQSDGYTFRIFKEALNRKVINAPIMKTNFQLGISGSMENLSRLADEKTQREMYFEGIENTLPKLARALPDVFTVADATSGMQGQGPLALGEPAFLNLVLASKSAAALDAVFCEATMLKIPPYATSSNSDFKKIEVVGNEIDALKYPVKAAAPNDTPHPDIKVIDGKACPACLNLMYNLTSKLIGLRGEQLSLIIGSMVTKEMLNGKERLVALGDCAIKRLGDLGIKAVAKIEENTDEIEQLVLLKKLLTTEGEPAITPIDKVRSKMKKLLSKVIG